ncbi:MAG: type IV pilus assembly protein PilM [Capsulimonadaceae bacterium]|nr:type IV pilus assembly protein PilM [Capsulimonadaceae bacterium]
MILSQLFGSETIIGVDIGSRLIKVVLAEPSSAGRWKVTRASSCTTPAEAVKDGIIVERHAAADALRSLLSICGLSHATGAVAAVAGPGVMVRHVQLPKMSEATLRKSVRYEAAKYISASVDDCCIEFEILGPAVGSDDKMDVMLVAVPQEMINSRLETLELADLEPISMELEAFAVQRALIDSSPTRPGEGASLAVLSMGASFSELNIVANGYHALSRNIAIAGNQFTNALKSESKCTWEEAEQIKSTADMSALLNPEADPEATKVARCVQPVLDEVMREVRRSTNFFRSQVNEGSIGLPSQVIAESAPGHGVGLANISRLIVTGGSASLMGLERYMSARLGMPVEIWNAFDNPRLDTITLPPDVVEREHSIFSQCLGLALKESFSDLAAVLPQTPARKAA